MQNLYQKILIINDFCFSKIFKKKYILNDIKSYKNISNFVFSIIKYAKKFDIKNQYNQLICISNVITFKIRKILRFSKKLL